MNFLPEAHLCQKVPPLLCEESHSCKYGGYAAKLMDMTLHVRPDAGIPMPDKNQSEGFMPTLNAAAATARLLLDAGLEVTPTEADQDAAAKLARQMARAPGSLNTATTTATLMKQTPAALLLTEQVLKDFGHKIVQEAEQIRHLVTNKLVQETENPDARVRIRALELLGKISDVGLFSERKELTVTHQTADDVRERLKARLAKLIPTKPVQEIEEAQIVLEPDEIIPPAEFAGPIVEDDEEDDVYFNLNLEPRTAAKSLFDEEEEDDHA